MTIQPRGCFGTVGKIDERDQLDTFPTVTNQTKPSAQDMCESEHYVSAREKAECFPLAATSAWTAYLRVYRRKGLAINTMTGNPKPSTTGPRGMQRDYSRSRRIIQILLLRGICQADYFSLKTICPSPLNDRLFPSGALSLYLFQNYFMGFFFSEFSLGNSIQQLLLSRICDMKKIVKLACIVHQN